MISFIEIIDEMKMDDGFCFGSSSSPCFLTVIDKYPILTIKKTERRYDEVKKKKVPRVRLELTTFRL